jgi:hypothetical protein
LVFKFWLQTLEAFGEVVDGAAGFWEDEWLGRCRADDPTGMPFFAQVSVEPIATGSGFVDEHQMLGLGWELADEGIDVGLSGTDGSEVSNFGAVIRIIDPDFQGMDRIEREPAIWKLLHKLPEEVFVNITMLLLLTPEEAETSLASQEFDHPIPSRL